jgi:hypothetical protein
VGSLPIEMLGSAMRQAKHVGLDVLHPRTGCRRPWSEAGGAGAALKIGGRPQHGVWISDADGD